VTPGLSRPMARIHQFVGSAIRFCVGFRMLSAARAIVTSGAWLVMMRGAGQVHSKARREIPQYLIGDFHSLSPRVKGRCGQSFLNTEVTYQQVGPIRASRNATYYLANGRQLGSLETCQAIYSAPFDPSNVKANLVGSGFQENAGWPDEFNDQWQVELQADKDYWLVIQPNTATVVTGEYFFVLAPPAPVHINPGLTGLWADLNTPGQGMYLDVFNSIDAVFMAWFTYDLQRPGPGVNAVFGDPGHRWLTGLGAIEGNSSDIEVVWTAGGLFDSSHPKPARNVNGHVRLEFDSCTSGRAIYNFGSPLLSGVVDLKRPFEDALGIAHCEQFQQGPGIPGPL